MTKKKKPKSKRIEIYLPPEERSEWDRTLALSTHESMASLVRRLMRTEHRRLLRKGMAECPS